MDPSLPPGAARGSSAWSEARGLVWSHRRRLLLGLLLLVVGRLASLVLPASSKYLVDEVVGKSRGELLGPLALATGAATLIQAGHVVLAVADPRGRRPALDQRMRRRVHATWPACRASFFDSTRAGS